MGVEHKEPSRATTKQLYGTAFVCAFVDCRQPLYRLDADGKARHLNSRICHIAARRPGGPRWDPDMTEAVNASHQNLLLMCTPHASEIDEPSSVERYPADLLHEWKSKQLKITELIQKNWQISATEADEVVRASSGMNVVADRIELGGAGGIGMSAGGGGGGALGPGAMGGPGGNGGRLHLGAGYGSEADIEHARRMLQALGDTENRGTGGGGQGAVGPGAMGGPGGPGGDAFFEKMYLAVGRYEVLPGRRGEDLILNQIDESGVLQGQRIIRQADVTYTPYPPTAGRELNSTDLDNGFAVTAMILAESFMFRRGMVDLLDAFWQAYEFSISPFRAAWALVVEIDPGSLGVGDRAELQVLVRDPEGQCRLRECFDVGGTEPTEKIKQCTFLSLNFTGSESGRWTVEIVSKAIVLRSLPVRVTCPPPPESDDGGGMVAFMVELPSDGEDP